MSINRKGVLAAALSLIYPGFGQAYLRKWLRALGWFALSLVTVYLLVPHATLQTYQHALETGNVAMLTSVSLPIEATLSVLAVRLCNGIDAYFVAIRQSTPSRATDGQPTCPACGRTLDTDLDFCPWCTTRLEWYRPPTKDAE